MLAAEMEHGSGSFSLSEMDCHPYPPAKCLLSSILYTTYQHSVVCVLKFEGMFTIVLLDSGASQSFIEWRYSIYSTTWGNS